MLKFQTQQAWHLLLSGLATCALIFVGHLTADDRQALSYTLELTTAHNGFDGKMCWVHARAGAIPPNAPGNSSDAPHVIMTMQKLLLTGSDVFYALNETRSSDDGRTWTKPEAHESFARQTVVAYSTAPTGAEIAPDLLQPGDETTVCDFAPKWHSASQRLLGIGQTVWYRNNRVMHVRPRGIAYAVYQPREKRWSDWKTIRPSVGREVSERRVGKRAARRSTWGRCSGAVLLQETEGKTVLRCRLPVSI